MRRTLYISVGERNEPVDETEVRGQAFRGRGYAVARCRLWAPRRTLTTLETPSSCMVTP